jgi:hypothetical protein
MTGGVPHRGDARSNGLIALGRALPACGGVPSVIRRYARRLTTTGLPLAAALALSACGLLPTQTPAPIVEHSYIPSPNETETEAAETEEPASTPAAPEPASTPKPAPAPKPKRKIVKPKPPEPPPAPPPEPPEPPPPPQIITTRLMQHEQLHGLLDAEVQRPDGKVVGRAVDMYVDASSKPKLLMVNLAGFMGVGDRKVNFPWSAFKFTPNAKPASITFAPPAPAAKGKSADPVPKPQPVSETPPNLLQLVDSTVTQKNGARIGRVVDVLVDAQAEPQALVVDLSTSLAEDKRHIAASWSDLHVVTRNKQQMLQMDFNDAQLKASPTYAADQPIKIVSPVDSAAAASAASAASAAGASAAASGSAAQAASATTTPASAASPGAAPKATSGTAPKVTSAPAAASVKATSGAAKVSKSGTSASGSVAPQQPSSGTRLAR